MKIFSEEHLQQLRDEYQLVSRTLAHLKPNRAYHQTYGSESTACAIGNLIVKKIELEATIETLQDFLN